MTTRKAKAKLFGGDGGGSFAGFEVVAVAYDDS
jgi:hypothetical protein